jgi:hypothetical protein
MFIVEKSSAYRRRVFLRRETGGRRHATVSSGYQAFPQGVSPWTSFLYCACVTIPLGSSVAGRSPEATVSKMQDGAEQLTPTILPERSIGLSDLRDSSFRSETGKVIVTLKKCSSSDPEFDRDVDLT